MNKLRAGPDYDPATETLYDSKGNAVTQDYIDELSAAAEAGYEVVCLDSDASSERDL